MGPALLSVTELLLNVALAQAFGRKFIPLLIVGEAAVGALCELLGNGLGTIVGEGIRPFTEGLVAELINT